MKKFILALFLVSQFALAGTAQVNSVVNMGGIENSSTSTMPLEKVGAASGDFVSLKAGFDTGAATTAGNFYPFYKNGTPYQVPVGKSFHVTKTCSESPGGSNLYWQMVSDTASISFDQAGALTSGTYESGAAARYSNRTHFTAATWECSSFPYVFAASTYPAIQIGTGANTMQVRVMGIVTTP